VRLFWEQEVAGSNPVAPTLFRPAEKQKEKTLDENHSWFEPERAMASGVRLRLAKPIQSPLRGATDSFPPPGKAKRPFSAGGVSGVDLSSWYST